MTKRTLLLALAALFLLAAPAYASSVAYIDGNNLWLSSPDGTKKVQLSQGGDADYPYGQPSQGPDGQTVVYHRDAFDSDGQTVHRPVLYLYGADGKVKSANVMPVYAGGTAPIYPIGLDMDWDSKTVAFGYYYCGWACQTSYKGFWLTFSDQQPMNPSNPQGQSDAYNPTFYKHRVVFSDSGGRIFVQPDVNEAPFTSSYTGWLDVPDFRLSRAEVSMTGNFVALDWTQYQPNTTTVIGSGIAIGQHEGTVPSNVNNLCNVPIVGKASNLTFSYDGTQIAWKDDEGVKVAGVPNLAAGTDTCQLTAPPLVISATGSQPHFGGADVAAILKSQAPADPATPTPTTPGADTPSTPSGPTTPATRKLVISLPAKVTAKAFAKGVVVQVSGAAAGKLAGSAAIPASVARKTGISAKSAALAAAVSRTVVISRGSAVASGKGTVKLKLVPTKAAKRAAKRLRKAAVTITVSQGAASASAKLKLG